jgi:hypothetical protein
MRIVEPKMLLQSVLIFFEPLSQTWAGTRRETAFSIPNVYNGVISIAGWGKHLEIFDFFHEIFEKNHEGTIKIILKNFLLHKTVTSPFLHIT